MTVALASESDGFPQLATIVAAVLKFLSTHETTVSEAVSAIWAQCSISNDALAELARRGLQAEVHRALSVERFTQPRILAPVTPFRRLQNPAESPHPQTVPPGPPRMLSVTLTRVRYAGADNRIRPLAKFVIADVQAARARAKRTIDGETRVYEWFGLLEREMIEQRIDRVADLPADVLASLLESSPWAND